MLLDIDECSTGDHNCTQNQQCVNMLGTFICECIGGYELVNGNCEGNQHVMIILFRLSLIVCVNDPLLNNISCNI